MWRVGVSGLCFPPDSGCSQDLAAPASAARGSGLRFDYAVLEKLRIDCGSFLAM